MRYEIREISEEIVHTVKKTVKVGSDGLPLIDGNGAEVAESVPVILRSHNVLVVVTEREDCRPVRVPILGVQDSDTVLSLRLKAEVAVKSYLGL